MHKTLIVIFVLHSSFSILHLQAQSLASCLTYAREHSLRMKQSKLQVARSRRNEGTFFEIEKTAVSLSQDPTSGGSPDNALTLSQSIDFPTVYSSRRQKLKAETRIAESKQQLTLRELEKDITTAYSSLLYYQQQVLLLQKNDTLLYNFVKIAKTRVDNGEGSRLELINAQQQKVCNHIQLETAKTKMENVNLTLRQLMNYDKPIVPIGDLASFLDAEEQGSTVYNYSQSLIGQLMENEVSLRQCEWKLAKQGYLPSFTLGWRHQLLISGINPYGIERTRFEKGNWMGFEFGVSFPLFFGSQKAKTAVARYDLDIARNQSDELRKQQESEYTIALHNLYVAKDNLDQYAKELLPRAIEMRRLSQVEYEAGEISYVEYIQNLSAAISVELQMADAADEHNKAIITYNYLNNH